MAQMDQNEAKPVRTPFLESAQRIEESREFSEPIRTHLVIFKTGGRHP
jgi:hypothetical protein